MFSIFYRKARYVALLFCLLPLLGLKAQVYSRIIYVPAHLSPEVTEAVSDMAYWLEQAGGQHIEVNTNSHATLTDGIQLLPLEDANLPAEIKKQINTDGQSFYLIVNNGQSAQIIGTGTNSFINGIYTFLQELGFRWYMPGDNWAIVPQLNKISLRIKKIYKPDFQNRSYFGTGGIAAVPEVDPQNTFQKDFAIWNRRNRISSDYDVKGHTGMAFYQANQKELNNHPEYSCHDKVNPNGRIDISNPNAVNLFVNWALQQANPQKRFSIIGVEPADGSGGPDDCLPSNMPQIKSWSDKYFWLANEVAEKAKEKGLNALVELYAYSSHTAPPGFALKENVYPVIIPYAFQTITSPEEFIELWNKKMEGRSMGIYDYWNITQWSSDLPQFSIYSIPQKLRFWKQNNITTINLESTNAKGPMGHAFWLAAQMMWNTGLSFDILYNQFLTQCFGPAAPDIKRMYDRWSNNYQGAMDVALSLNDLSTASAKTKDAAIQRRLSELKAYVHYLKLYYDYQQDPSAARYDTLLMYMYRIHNLRLVQTYALKASYIKPPTAYTKQQVKSVAPIDEQAIEENFESDVRENPVTYTLSNFAFDITKAKPVVVGTQNTANPLYINGTNNYAFYLPAPQRLNLQAGATADTKLLIKDEKGKTWYEKEIAGSKQGYEMVSLELPKGKYVLTFGAYYRFGRIIFPPDIAFFSAGKNYDNSGYPLLYVYVPKDVTEIVYTDALRPGINGRGDWINPDGKHTTPELVKYTTYRVPVPQQYRGRVWVLNIGHRNFQLLNIPDLYSLRLFKYDE